MRLFGFLFILTFLGMSCQSPVVEETHSDCELLFMDSLQAAKAIVKDDTEHFFEAISMLDIAIQLKFISAHQRTRETFLQEYRFYLQDDVRAFTETEKALLKDVLAEAFRLCSQLSPDLIPDTLGLIKTPGKHYGPSVFYTRERNIIIPQSDLLEPNRAELLRVMLHELFHIYSRYHPKQRRDLYALIGFRPLPGGRAALRFPPKLEALLLTNPDGINVAYAIRLPHPTRSDVQAIPLIRSRYPAFNPGIRAFFPYLQFDLYAIRQKSDGTFVVLSRSDGSSTLLEGEKKGFYAQIGDNTNYIIHPDEILADNFALLLLEGVGGDGLLKGMRRVMEAAK
ncbi:MAG: hypothetical protein SH848_06815 [Saprospiraceae bacterium]|nr:hypothetical protein [Saprospiraceae bacterium]MDZ4703621.1 hypothetical protein [Saprospiraceae bacterium]